MSSVPPKPILTLVACLVLLAVVPRLLGQEVEAPAMTGNSVEYCVGCHGTQPTGDPAVLARIKTRAVDIAAFAESVHGDKSCTFCHYGFGDFPHAEKALTRRKPQCTSCHRGEKYEDWGFPQVREEFEASVHAVKQPEQFSCVSCHDPHTFEPSRNSRTIPLTVEYSNTICLDCHQDVEAMATRLTVATRPLEITHDFLPNRQLHWRTVRCLDCHTPLNERMVSHRVLPKQEAVRNCVECHRQESRLLSKLYIHRVKEERQTAGFLNSVVLNDAYVVGMTRNRYLDALSVFLAAVTFFGILLHALGRFIAKRRANRT